MLCEGCRWRSLPSDFPNWQTVYTSDRNWRIDGTWVQIHDHLRSGVRLDHERAPSPSEVIVDSQSVKTAAMVSKAVGYDAAKLVLGRKRHLTVDTLGLVLRVLVTAASVGERSGGVPCPLEGEADGLHLCHECIRFGLMAATTAIHSCSG